DETHPPPVEVRAQVTVQLGRLAQRLLGEVMVVLARSRGPHPGRPLIPDLALRVQHGAVVEVQHPSADDRGRDREVREPHRADDRLGLGDRVVIEEEHVVALLGLQGLEHRP
ncbi:hypothetical protein ABE10_11485, partial [Bacillus toyonensis]|nr:hypothetical protein [Bacillus toyonensis]